MTISTACATFQQDHSGNIRINMKTNRSLYFHLLVKKKVWYQVLHSHLEQPGLLDFVKRPVWS